MLKIGRSTSKNYIFSKPLYIPAATITVATTVAQTSAPKINDGLDISLKYISNKFGPT
jgi:hypothetical protein